MAAIQILQVTAPYKHVRGKNTSGKALVHPHGVSHLVISGQTISADQALAILRFYPTSDRGEISSTEQQKLSNDARLTVVQMDALADIALVPSADTYNVWATGGDAETFQALSVAAVQALCLSNSLPTSAATKSELVAMLVLAGVKPE